VGAAGGLLYDGALHVGAQDGNAPVGGKDAYNVACRDAGPTDRVADHPAGDNGAAAVNVAAEIEVAQDAFAVGVGLVKRLTPGRNPGPLQAAVWHADVFEDVAE